MNEAGNFKVTVADDGMLGSLTGFSVDYGKGGLGNQMFLVEPLYD